MASANGPMALKHSCSLRCSLSIFLSCLDQSVVAIVFFVIWKKSYKESIHDRANNALKPPAIRSGAKIWRLPGGRKARLYQHLRALRKMPLKTRKLRQT